MCRECSCRGFHHTLLLEMLETPGLTLSPTCQGGFIPAPDDETGSNNMLLIQNCIAVPITVDP